MLSALAVAGWTAGSSPTWRILLAVAGPAAAAGMWALWLAPASARRLAGIPLLAAKAAVFTLAGAALALVGHLGWGAALIAVSLGDLAVIHRRDRRSSS